MLEVMMWVLDMDFDKVAHSNSQLIQVVPPGGQISN